MTHLRAVARAVGRWAADWRTGAAVAATAFVALLIVIVVSSTTTTQDALDARQATASAASRRIDRFNARIEELGTEISTAAFTNGVRIGELADQVAALQEQVRQMGGDPVVPSTTTTTSTTRPRSATTTTTTRPPSTTTTTRPCAVSVAGRCIGGSP